MTLEQESNKKPKITNATLKYGRNAIYNVVGYVIRILCYLIITPYALHTLGNARFGVWAVASVVTEYARFSNLGLDRALIKFVAELWPNRDIIKLNKLINSAFVFYIGVAGSVTVTLILMRSSIINIFRIPMYLYNEAMFVLAGFLLIFFSNLIFSIFRSILLGIQRMDIDNGIISISRILNSVGIYLFLFYDFGLKGLVVNSFLVTLFVGIANMFWVYRLVKDFSINPLFFSLVELKRTLNYGIYIIMVSIGGLFLDPLNKGIISRYISLGYVSFYEIANRIHTMVRGIWGVAIDAILPASSELQAMNEMERVEKLYLLSNRLLFLFAFPAFLLLISLAKQFITLWLGKGYEEVALSLQILLTGHFVSLLSQPAFVILQGIGKPNLSAIAAIATGILNILIAVPLAIIIGFNGVLIGCSSALILDAILVFILFHRATHFHFYKLANTIPLSAIVAVAILAVGLFWIAQYVHSWFMFISMAGLFLLLYLGISSYCNLINKKDKQLIFSLANSFIK